MLIAFTLLTAHVSEFYLGCKVVANFKIVRKIYGQIWRLKSNSFSPRDAENTSLFSGLSVHRWRIRYHTAPRLQILL
jgi:hypothetical protein